MLYEKKGWPHQSMKNLKTATKANLINPNWSITSEKKLQNYEQTGQTVMVGSTCGAKRRPISAKIQTINNMKKDYRKKTNTMNLTLDQLKALLNKKKQENLRLTKAVQNQFNFLSSISYDPDVVQSQGAITQKAGMHDRTPSKDKLFMKQKNVLLVVTLVKKFCINKTYFQV